VRIVRRITLSILCGLFAACASTPTEPIVAIPEDADGGRIRVLIPEVYELANVVLAMTDFGLNDTNAILRQGTYYQDVRSRFDGVRSQPFMKDLQLEKDDPVRHYYELRENSFAYGFDGNRIVRGERYPVLWTPNLFRERLEEVQAFADASGFRAFYAEHQPYYATTIQRYRDIAQIETMIAWMETEFEDAYDRYTVVLSPLVYGSHSANWQRTRLGREGLMFVAGPDVDGGVSLTLGERKAIVQRIVLTEVDHLFVNPVSDRYASQIRTAFSDRAKWTTDTSSFYESPLAVFNEYMTWAVFTLWIESHAPAEDFERIVSRMEQQMEGSRRFIRFKAFNRALLALYRARTPGTTIADLYPQIVEWARTAP
jgi:hypothetical protein